MQDRKARKAGVAIPGLRNWVRRGRMPTGFSNGRSEVTLKGETFAAGFRDETQEKQ